MWEGSQKMTYAVMWTAIVDGKHYRYIHDDPESFEAAEDNLVRIVNALWESAFGDAYSSAYGPAYGPAEEKAG
jgi:hypothetical protein